MSFGERLFLLGMLLGHMALGVAVARDYYLRRMARIVQRGAEQAAERAREQVMEFGLQCYQEGRRDGANEMATRAIRVGLRRQ